MRELRYKTSGTEDYDHLYVTTNETNSAVFLVKSCAEARILLSHEMDDMIRAYEVIIGGRSNTHTAIAEAIPGGSNIKRSVESIDILSCEHYRPFWLRWDERTIEFGRGLDMGAHQVISWGNYGGDWDFHALAISTGASHIGQWIFPPTYGKKIKS